MNNVACLILHGEGTKVGGQPAEEQKLEKNTTILVGELQDGGMDKELPCLNCRLIEMGEMACYQDRCPQCGQVPPGKKHLVDEPGRPTMAQQQAAAAARQQSINATNLRSF